VDSGETADVNVELAEELEVVGALATELEVVVGAALDTSLEGLLVLAAELTLVLDVTGTETADVLDSVEDSGW